MLSSQSYPEVHHSENTEPPPSGGNRTFQRIRPEEVERSLRLFHPPGSRFEIRILDASGLQVDGGADAGPRPYSGYFDDPRIAADVLGRAITGPASFKGIYFTLNPVKSGDGGQVTNTLRPARKGESTSSTDIESRRWIFIDFDPERPTGVSSTNAEHEAALSLAATVAQALQLQGWPEPVICDSGNGAHLCYAVDLPSNDDGLIQRTLVKMEREFRRQDVKIDLRVYDPARICKVYGTLACKGESSAERPHRMSAILSVPTEIIVVERDLLEAFAGSEKPTQETGGGDFDIDSWIERHRVPVGSPEPWLRNGRRWPIQVCPFNADHNRGEAVLLQLPGGALAFKCHHNSCREKQWKEFRALYDGQYPSTSPGGSDAQPQFAFTDSGNADRLEASHGSKLRFNVERGKWLLWDGRRWVLDESERVYTFTLDRIRAIPKQEISSTMTPAQVKEIQKWAKTSESKTKLDATVALMQRKQELVVRSERLDAEDWTLNVANGILDLRSGMLLRHDPSMYCSKFVDVVYDAEAQAPLWEKFLDEIMGGEKEIISFLQRAVGYSLTGSTQEQCLFILHGTGANGKSTFTTTLRLLFSDYAAQMDPATLRPRRDGNARGDIARLDGARLVLSSETGDGNLLDEALIKQMTGGDPIVARFLYQEDFEFMPKFKIWLATNKKPEIRGQEEGIWRRIRLIPFDVTIPEAKRDPHLLEKLREECPGILAWAVRGCLDFVKDGLQPPIRVKQATQEYRNESDALADFLDTCCSVGLGERCTAKELFVAYEGYCAANSVDALKMSPFGKKIKERGFKQTRSGRARGYEGVAPLSAPAGSSAPGVRDEAADDAGSEPLIGRDGWSPDEEGGSIFDRCAEQESAAT